MAQGIERKQHVVDATGQSLGRLASEVAMLLRGKRKVSYQPHIDGGDIVLVKNIQDIKITGKKEEQKMYYRASGYPGGLKETQMKKLKAENPQEMFRLAVRGMLPDTKLRKGMLKRLTIQ